MRKAVLLHTSMDKDNIKNIIFDMGGVLVGLDACRCIQAFHKIGCEKIAYYVEKHLTEDLFLDTELGRISQHEFCNEVRRITSSQASDEEVAWAWNELLDPIPARKLAFLDSLKKRGYRLFLLSNTNITHWSRCRDDFFTLSGKTASDYFERIFLSFEMHLAKPSTEIFNEALRIAGVQAGETLFIDDSAENCKAAESVGMAVLHETTGDTFLDL